MTFNQINIMLTVALLIFFCICLNYLVVFPEKKDSVRMLKEPVKRDK